MYRLRTLLPPAALAASVGVLAALSLAARKISAQGYLGHGLWRTALWVSGNYSAVGAVAGGAGALLVILSLMWWPRARRAVRRPSREAPEQRAEADTARLGSRLVLFLSVSTAATVVLMPMDAPPPLGVPYRPAAGACLALLWVVASAAAASSGSASARGPAARPANWFGLGWSFAAGLAYVAALSRIWAVAKTGAQLALLAGGALVVAVVAYAALYRPAQARSRWLGRALERPVAHLAARALVIVVLASALGLWAAGWVVGVQVRARARAAGRNLIIIAIDTLRADGASLLPDDERQRDLTPNVRELLVPRGTVFTQAISQAPWTLPAFASILTGLYPEQHGAERLTSKLARDKLTLAEVLREAGYLTMSVVSGYLVSSGVGVGQGFTLRDESQVLNCAAITSANVTDRAIAMLAAHRDEPFFLFVHYFDPHDLYQQHSGFGFGRYRGVRPLRRPGDSWALGWAPRDRPLTPAEQAGLRAIYDGEIAYTDLHVGRLLGYLDSNGMWDSTCVVFVADHGEEFLDHGDTGHDHTVYQELIQVPLVIADPWRKAPPVIDEPVETRWLFGTMLDTLGGDLRGERLPSHDLLALPQEERYVRSSTHPRLMSRPGRERVWLSCILDPRYKLIRDHLSGQISLFDLADDSGETTDLSEELPEQTARLEEVLWELDDRVGGTAPPPPLPRLSREELDRLKDLGYL